eukprot:TRINITY_DN11167_c0_g1_i1.p1 TRINITY_DN11167_c0_g1~~TRINITY_DN11167_c0_g1_i1.p1  ORF type:complete len:177 (+),score=31.43 TRINITY_DN11167_c0_g1_i1:409-939(+)
MCLECLCCPGLAISATRIHLMHEYALGVDPMDNKIIRFNNCIQCVACVCHVVGIFIKEARHLARLVDLFAHLVFLCTAGCMAGQIHREKSFQIQKEALLPPECQGDEANQAYLSQPVDDHSIMAAPQCDQSYPPTKHPPEYSAPSAPAPVGYCPGPVQPGQQPPPPPPPPPPPATH